MNYRNWQVASCGDIFSPFHLKYSQPSDLNLQYCAYWLMKFSAKKFLVPVKRSRHVGQLHMSRRHVAQIMWPFLQVSIGGVQVL